MCPMKKPCRAFARQEQQHVTSSHIRYRLCVKTTPFLYVTNEKDMLTADTICSPTVFKNYAAKAFIKGSYFDTVTNAAEKIAV